MFLQILVDDNIYHYIHIFMEIFYFNVMYIAIKQLSYICSACIFKKKITVKLFEIKAFLIHMLFSNSCGNSLGGSTGAFWKV